MTSPHDRDLTQFTSGVSERSPFSIVVLDTDLRILWVNPRMAGLRAEPRERWVGRRLDEMLSGLETGDVESTLRHLLETGERVTDVEHRGPLVRGLPADRVWSVSGFRLEDSGGSVIGVALIASDVTDRSRDRDRLALLNEASEKIGSTLDIWRTAEETLDVLVPRIADTAHINMLAYVMEGGQPPRFEQGGGSVRMEIAAARWVEGQALPEELSVGSIAYLDTSSKYYRWLAAGRTIFEPLASDLSPEFEEMLSGSEFFLRRFRLARDAGVHSALIMSISARGVILGTIALFRIRQPAFTEQDAALAQDVLGRSAICLDNARVYTRERVMALELQRSMLPRTIAQASGIEVAYRYEPANTAAEIGGDWFDVVHQPDGRVALVVGDVTGHDIHAASLMGQLRTATRTLAALALSPAEVLNRLDTMVQEMGGEVGATCVFAVFEPTSRRCDIARAGHPPPALVSPTGSVDFVELPSGLPLGVGAGVDVGGSVFESAEVVLEPGSILVLYTDGLIETRDAAIDVGLNHLARVLAAGNTEPFGDRYAASLINRLAPDPEDDIAILLARVSLS